MARLIWGLSLLVSALAVFAEDNTGNADSRTVVIREGQVIKEEHEVEVYDYHTGTFQTYKVYREPSKQPETAEHSKAHPPKPNQ